MAAAVDGNGTEWANRIKMNIEAIHILVIFFGTIFAIGIFMEIGYRIGRSIRRRSKGEKESAVSSITGSILALVAFMLAFTFSMAASRYDDRKELVRNEANAISTAYLRSDFLSEPDRGETKKLFREYLDVRLAANPAGGRTRVNEALADSERIQRQLWNMAVVNARKDMNSDIAALYIDSLNTMIDIHSLRVAVGLKARIPSGVWLALSLIVFLGVIGVGYQAAIAESGRSVVAVLLTMAFAVVIALIVTLDHPLSGYISVSQQPLIDVRASMAADAGAK